MVDRSLIPVRRRKDERPRELLRAAMALFVEQGFAATRIDDIAERAGVSKGTVYLYFDHKEDLFKHLIAARFFCGVPLDGAMQEDRAGVDMLRTVVAGWHEALVEGPLGGVVKLVFTEVHHFPALADFWVATVMGPTRAWVRKAVGRGVDGAEFLPIDPDVVTNALVLPIVVNCLHRQVITPRATCPLAFAERAFVERHLELIVRGLAVTRPMQVEHDDGFDPRGA